MKPLFGLRARAQGNWLVCGLCAFFTLGACQAQPPTAQPEQRTWLAASNLTLDQLRGGFDVGSGLAVSFGISRAVVVNGQLVTSTLFQVADIGKLTSAQAQVLGQQAGLQALVIQNGPGNAIAAGAASTPLAIYVQNTLNNQTIHTETVIQATSNSLGMVKSLNLQATINDAINSAIRSR